MNEPVFIAIEMVWVDGCPQNYYIMAIQGTKCVSTPIILPTKPNQLEADIKKAVELLTKDIS